MKLIPDTNFLIYLARFKLLDQLNYFGKIIILKPVLKELIILSKSEKEKAEDRVAAKIVMLFFDKIKDKLEYVNVEGYADDTILEKAKENDAVVGTMDKELSKRLKAAKIKVLGIRQEKFLEEV